MTTEYLDLSFLDFVCFNVYLHREEDFRRYLTHLMAAAGERPLMLSETGLDTIREGEEHQAELLSWQARAAFELGLSGFIVFAFTDEWHTGGVEISDWAFGLVKKDRTPKRAFDTVGEVFRGELPPPLARAPKASVIVAAYNAAATIGACIESLKTLHYPNFETIVVDDGSTDATAQIVEASQTRLIRRDHRGLGAARNAGVEAATGDIIAFIDADALADCGLALSPRRGHHAPRRRRRGRAELRATGLRCGIRARAGNPTRSARRGRPAHATVWMQPGDHESRATKCRWLRSIIRRSRRRRRSLVAAGRTSCGQARADRLSAHPVRSFIHQRRRDIGDYLRQQRSYGARRSLLYKKYPLRTSSPSGLYGGAGTWLSALLGGPRVYHGTFGRGLFQSMYAGADLPWLAELPQTFEWIAASVLLAMLGVVSGLLGALGCLGIIISIVDRDSLRGIRAAALPGAALLSPCRPGDSSPSFIWLDRWCAGFADSASASLRSRARAAPADLPARCL